MGTRLRKTHQDDVRSKIQADRIIAWLQAGIFGEKFQGKPVNMDSARVRAACELLKKRLPDLSQVSGAGEGGAHLVQAVINVRIGA